MKTFLWVLLAGAVAAQSVTGSIQGTVIFRVTIQSLLEGFDRRVVLPSLGVSLTQCHIRLGPCGRLTIQDGTQLLYYAARITQLRLLSRQR